MRKQSATPDRQISQLAARQHGVVTAAQLRGGALSSAGIARRVESGRLHRIHRGIYAVGHPRLSFEGRCLAAALACGDGAVVSHLSAAYLWRLLPIERGLIHVTVAGRNGRRKRPGIAVHRSLTLDAGARTRHLGIPVTRPARTIEDLRRTAGKRIAQAALRKAIDCRLLDRSALGADPDLSRSELERRFLALCRRHRLPPPENNVSVGPYEVDFVWPERRLIVETDGWRFHSSRSSFEADRARDARLQAEGFRVIRITHRRLMEAPGGVAALLRRVLAETPAATAQAGQRAGDDAGETAAGR